MYVNGQEVGTAQSVANAWTGNDGTLRIGWNGSDALDAYIGRVFISKDPHTPEIWTAFGKPLHVPLTNLG